MNYKDIFKKTLIENCQIFLTIYFKKNRKQNIFSFTFYILPQINKNNIKRQIDLTLLILYLFDMLYLVFDLWSLFLALILYLAQEKNETTKKSRIFVV